MHHIPILNNKKEDEIIEFSHINEDAPAEHWKKENIISLNNIKINIFMEGEFRFFAGGKSYTPVYGDICVLSPFKMHSGQIKSPTHTDYFQFDIGMKAFLNVPGGNELLKSLVKYSSDTNFFIRPQEKHIKQAISICNSVESALMKENKALAFAKTVEIVSLLLSIYEVSQNIPNNVLTLVTKNAINYIRDNYSEQITLKSLSENLNVSPSYLSRIFKKETGMGVHEYLTTFRITKASYLLKTHSVSEVCYMCAFSDTSHFIAVFKKHFGCTPNRYKKDILR